MTFIDKYRCTLCEASIHCHNDVDCNCPDCEDEVINRDDKKMTKFTDDDLRQLKDQIKDHLYVNIGDDQYGDPNEIDLKALIMRLELAEEVILQSPDICPDCDNEIGSLTYREAEEAWRKISGK